MLHRENFLMNLALLLKTYQSINSHPLVAFSIRLHLMENGESMSVNIPTLLLSF